MTVTLLHPKRLLAQLNLLNQVSKESQVRIFQFIMNDISNSFSMDDSSFYVLV